MFYRASPAMQKMMLTVKFRNWKQKIADLPSCPTQRSAHRGQKAEFGQTHQYITLNPAEHS